MSVHLDLCWVHKTTSRTDKMKTGRLALKQWMQKLINQLNYDGSAKGEDGELVEPTQMNEDRATLLYILDIYSKHLIDLEHHPERKTRDLFDSFSKELVKPDVATTEKVLFRLRQFFSTYRVTEYTYVRTSFEEFKGILWDIVDQLADDVRSERAEDKDIGTSLYQLKEAVEADSIDALKTKAREFVDHYVEHQSKREFRRAKRMKGIKKNLDVVKKQLLEANKEVSIDHMTQAYNRKSFDERLKQQWQLFEISKVPCTMIILDIDFFKKVNDTYGHDIGDFVIKECVRMLKESFVRETDFIARIGGEEFAVILPDYAAEHAVVKAEAALARIRKEVFVHGTGESQHQLKFTVSMGIAQIAIGETAENWLKRADQALYESKHGGRDRYSVADEKLKIVDSKGKVA